MTAVQPWWPCTPLTTQRCACGARLPTHLRAWFRAYDQPRGEGTWACDRCHQATRPAPYVPRKRPAKK